MIVSGFYKFLSLRDNKSYLVLAVHPIDPLGRLMYQNQVKDVFPMWSPIPAESYVHTGNPCLIVETGAEFSSLVPLWPRKSDGYNLKDTLAGEFGGKLSDNHMNILDRWTGGAPGLGRVKNLVGV